MSLYEILSDENVVESINNNLDYLVKCIPEIKYMMGFEHKHPHHHLDVWQHTLLALSFSENDFDILYQLMHSSFLISNSYHLLDCDILYYNYNH